MMTRQCLVSHHNGHLERWIFQTLNSSGTVIAVTPGLSRVSSVFMNALNTNEIGSQLYNPNRLSNMGELRELSV